MRLKNIFFIVSILVILCIPLGAYLYKMKIFHELKSRNVIIIDNNYNNDGTQNIVDFSKDRSFKWKEIKDKIGNNYISYIYLNEKKILFSTNKKLYLYYYETKKQELIYSCNDNNYKIVSALYIDKNTLLIKESNGEFDGGRLIKYDLMTKNKKIIDHQLMTSNPIYYNKNKDILYGTVREKNINTGYLYIVKTYYKDLRKNIGFIENKNENLSESNNPKFDNYKTSDGKYEIYHQFYRYAFKENYYRYELIVIDIENSNKIIISKSQDIIAKDDDEIQYYNNIKTIHDVIVIEPHQSIKYF